MTNQSGPPWIIEKKIKKGDYLYAKVTGHPNATTKMYVLYHRIVMENKIGRLLEKHEVVHHINGNKHDNREENLELTTLSEHTREHVRLKGRSYFEAICLNCGKNFHRRKAGGCHRNYLEKGYTSCSRSCGAKTAWLIRSGKIKLEEAIKSFTFKMESTRDPSWTPPVKRRFDKLRRFHRRKTHCVKWFQRLEYPEHLVSRIERPTKVNWPPVSEIKKMLLEMPLLEIGRRLGCTDNCVDRKSVV